MVMALRDWISGHQRDDTATPATNATVEAEDQSTVANVADVAVAREGTGENQPCSVVPNPCRGCRRLEIIEIMGKRVPGCLYQITEGEWGEGWKRLPEDLTTCIHH